MVDRGRFELPTSTLQMWRSNQLNYRPRLLSKWYGDNAETEQET